MNKIITEHQNPNMGQKTFQCQDFKELINKKSQRNYLIYKKKNKKKNKNKNKNQNIPDHVTHLIPTQQAETDSALNRLYYIYTLFIYLFIIYFFLSVAYLYIQFIQFLKWVILKENLRKKKVIIIFIILNLFHLFNESWYYFSIIKHYYKLEG